MRFKELKMICDALGGVDPPAERLDKDYVEGPRNPRKCVNCGKVHDCIVENSYTGERLTEIDKCKDCLMWGWFENNSNK